MKTKIIGLLGQAGSGKDTAAVYINRFLNEGPHARFRFKTCVEKVALADPMKRFCQGVFQFTDKQLWGPSEERDRVDPRYTRSDGAPLTPRHALQTLGTEWGRACYPDVWIDLAVRKAKERAALGIVTVITDCRFLNEARRLRELGASVWRIVRPAEPVAADFLKHSSETEQADPAMDAYVTYRIDNVGTLADLKEMVFCGLVQEGLVQESDRAGAGREFPGH